MIRLLIVDDEPLFRSGLRRTVPWEALGFQVVAEAINGKDALDQLAERGVDLVLTDIRMPVMDGLELLDRLRPLGIPGVVLSAYDEFSLVKQAFRRGAVDYILKDDFDDGDFRRIAAELSAPLQSSPNSDTLAVRDRAFRARVLLDQLSGVADGRYHTEGIGLEAPEPSIALGAFRIDWKLDGGRPELPPAALEAAARRALLAAAEQSALVAIPAPEASRLFAVLAEEEGPLDRGRLAARFAGLAERSLRNIASNYGSPVISVGLAYAASSRELDAAWRAAKRALDSSFFWGRGGIVTLEQAVARGGLREPLDTDARLRILEAALERRDFRSLAKRTKELEVDPRMHGGESVSAVRNLFRSYATLLASALRSVPALETEELSARLRDLAVLDELEADLRSLNAWLRSCLRLVSQAIPGASPLVRRCAAYVAVHYRSVLSVRSIAAKFSVNPSYLSRVCSAELGMSLTDYILETRVYKAAALLDRGGLRIYQVAEAVGFPNPETFTRAFKRVMGVSPKAYWGVTERQER